MKDKQSYSLKKRFLYTGMVFVIFLALAEIFLQVFGFVQVFEPFECNDLGSGARECRYTLNRDTPPFQAPKPEGTTRVVVIGGSAANGWPFEGAGFTGTIKVVLERHPSCEVIKLAVNGINTDVAKEILKEALVLLEPDVVVIYAGNNELLGHEYFNDLQHPRLKATAWWLRKNSTLWNIPSNIANEALSRGLAVEMMIKISKMEEENGQWLFTENERRKAKKLYLYHMEQMIRLCRKNDAVPVICTPASNLKEWVPMKSVHTRDLSQKKRDEIEKTVKEARKMIRSGKSAKAAATLLKVTKEDPDYAKAWFFLGKALYKSGRKSESVRFFEEAVEKADFHQQTPPSWNRDLRNLADGFSVTLADTDMHMREVSDTLPGFEYFLDGCHPTLEGHRLIASHILQEMADAGIILSEGEDLRIPSLESLTVLNQAGKLKLGIQLFNQAALLAFLVRPPEYYPVASRYMKESMELGFNVSVAETYRGYLSILDGNPGEAARQFTRAKKEDPAVFGAVLRNNFSHAVTMRGNTFDVKVLSDENLPVLYPNVKQEPLPSSAKGGPVYRFVWKDREYVFKALK